ncbi:MAG: LysM peptidoglycan-binding domain-containing protein [Betaproteobacteria bacterium]
MKLVACLALVALLPFLHGCTINETSFGDYETQLDQRDTPVEVDSSLEDGVNEPANFLESDELLDALDRMLGGVKDAVEQNSAEYGLDQEDDGTYRVKEGDSLSKIMERLAGDTQINPDFLQQVFIEANPRAFRRKNPNWLFAGARLRIPDLADFRSVVFKGSAVKSMKKDQEADPYSDWIKYPSSSPTD